MLPAPSLVAQPNAGPWANPARGKMCINSLPPLARLQGIPDLGLSGPSSAAVSLCPSVSGDNHLQYLAFQRGTTHSQADMRDYLDLLLHTHSHLTPVLALLPFYSSYWLLWH